MPKRAVVFAYHDVGVRCLQVLLRHQVDVALVVTHEDNPEENIWFDSVAALCAEHGIECIAPVEVTSTGLLDRLETIRPDLLFSFYYRHMLPPSILELARVGAFNMHGSLLPKYRGRAPVNWAVLHGETVTGATLHEMVVKPDAGAIVAQTSVTILPDDTAHDVFGKVVIAAEQTLAQVLPAMLNGHIPRQINDLAQGSYFSGRTAADGCIDWTQPAQVVYNLVRAVAPPYPGAWTTINDHRFVVVEARLLPDKISNLPLGLTQIEGKILGICGDAGVLDIRRLHSDDNLVTASTLQAICATTREAT
ncbi:MAG: formyltransferase [Pseudomonadota bacterium]